ncbi:hypothetical protein ECHHL_0738 [Ehrlichia chaffeensis str. Heartland]|uniref:Uncharacterized protein n=1 Tax=Ehrlichia chaffeensis (strain ATCC CRL-10679 / Arkansas) TaxID=205920 RepID=Q2GG03_EHRCR|nr:hypothetical protein [Ehrlichia chaffeensis]ABD45482.1 hypothetical protein ECH_0834 [Ehrlichia chaffeensis str. Arkansas]AHX03884.1 hypothetical protein ECHHL_0738 [Ehrlichia chaffeensis str. Heartland]AHX07841.1 hypothetical protein ECHOSC_0749 [Ehrlichia chaffeensis str. Osceola]AHX08385.1 hypothetical protein ECHSTV_0303 [Ehrlichia chaffeensis str. Saint Vincent]AHX09844.1 hypothetical protein ECHWAK_0310 [Ehrlichia chaffeensis str. Wakulla]
MGLIFNPDKEDDSSCCYKVVFSSLQFRKSICNTSKEVKINDAETGVCNE